ncbi:uncharacterized protein DSM5745_03708 [Aspergillus mulundensis]|uniref:Uncharacterized protein n=1 Tax=Aspergillus mulundensis TaxID=1810919 RepID=A0A3D8SLA9_9EURO|nr:hypothetical protein DSM5745_03708 [Aspergillus mulundensis]RDW87066.1 hypothetical protein DSM5745_03708 [Aspergillus mulundensis]
MSSENPADIRMPATESDPTGTSMSDLDGGVRIGNTSVVDDKENDRDEDEDPHLPSLGEYLKMTEEQKKGVMLDCYRWRSLKGLAIRGCP